MFIARVFKGRTVREFIICVLLIPLVVCVFWMSTFVLLLGGGLVALQAMVVSTGLPFAVILLVLCVTITMGLRSEKTATIEAKAER